jgi:hypothetical protein
LFSKEEETPDGHAVPGSESVPFAERMERAAETETAQTAGGTFPTRANPLAVAGSGDGLAGPGPCRGTDLVAGSGYRKADDLSRETGSYPGLQDSPGCPTESDSTPDDRGLDYDSEQAGPLFGSDNPRRDANPGTERPPLTPDDLPMEWKLVWSERAAILEYDAGLTRGHAEAMALTEIERQLPFVNREPGEDDE